MNKLTDLKPQVCPICGSKEVVSAGRQILARGIFHRYRCINCGKIFYGEVLKRFPLDVKENSVRACESLGFQEA